MIHEPRTDREVVENLAITLTKAICDGNDVKRQNYIRVLLIKFAEEIKRQAVEP